MPLSKNPLSKNEPGVATFCGRQTGKASLDLGEASFNLLDFFLKNS